MTPHKDTQFQILFPHPIHKVVKNKLANNLKIKLNVSFYDSVGEIKKIYNNTNVDIIFLEERLLDELSIQEKTAFDVEYLGKRSFWFDLKILWMTLIKVVRNDGVLH